MKNTVYIILLALILLAAGCDRFTHEFRPPESTDFGAALFTPMDAALDAAGTDGVSAVMDFYADNYLHFGITRTDRQMWLEDIYTLDPGALAQVSLLASEQQTDTLAVANWRLLITSADTRTVLADSTFTGERLVKRANRWLLKGNQMVCSVPNPNQHVVLEYFTFLGCPNCPPVEAKLHELQLQYGDQLSYLEHHTTAPLAVPGDGTYAYYGQPTALPLPSTIFQGQTVLPGSSTETLDSFGPLVASLATIETPIRYSNLLFNTDGDQVTGSVRITPLLDGFSLQDKALSAVLIEKESVFTNTQGEHMRNIVRGKSVISLASADLDEPVPFSVSAVSPRPDDLSLVIFVQHKPTAFANNATILGGVEIAVPALK